MISDETTLAMAAGTVLVAAVVACAPQILTTKMLCAPGLASAAALLLLVAIPCARGLCGAAMDAGTAAPWGRWLMHAAVVVATSQLSVKHAVLAVLMLCTAVCADLAPALVLLSLVVLHGLAWSAQDHTAAEAEAAGAAPVEVHFVQPGGKGVVALKAAPTQRIGAWTARRGLATGEDGAVHEVRKLQSVETGSTD